MNIDFAAVIVIVTLLLGSIWLIDILILEPRRHSQNNLYVKHNKLLPWYIDFSKSLFPILLAVLLFRSFIFEPFRIPSESMMPTLLKGDFILVNKFIYGLRLPVLNTKIAEITSPLRGDVVVFRYPLNQSDTYIKRVIGLPGDQLEYYDKQIYINGQAMTLSEISTENGYKRFTEQLGTVTHDILLTNNNYITTHNLWYGLKIYQEPKSTGIHWTCNVPKGYFFVMGDNRDNSADSRYWGLLSEDNLIGKAVLIWMNADCITLNGQCSRLGHKIR